MVYVRIKEVLEEKKKSKYWLDNNMSGNYTSLNKLINNKTVSVHFETLNKLCNVLDCEIGELVVHEKDEEI